MDAERFDAASRMFGVAGRRRLLTAGLGATLAGLLGRIADQDQPVAVATACATVGKSCRHAAQCCSGICTGKHGKKKCRGHGAGAGTPDQDVCADPDPAFDKCNTNCDCIWPRTTAGTSFCAYSPTGGCAACVRDADSVALGLPAGSACLVVDAGRCVGRCPSGTACNPPCPAAPPPASPRRPDLRFGGGHPFQRTTQHLRFLPPFAFPATPADMQSTSETAENNRPNRPVARDFKFVRKPRRASRAGAGPQDLSLVARRRLR